MHLEQPSDSLNTNALNGITAKNKTLAIDITVSFEHFQLSLTQQLSTQGITGVFGHSGSGKSTLLRVIAGLEKNAIGNISINQHELLNSQTNTFITAENRRCAVVFQDSRLFPHLNVRENLNYSAKRSPSSHLSVNHIIELTQLQHLAEQNVTRLSGGEQQRVALARAILAEPQLLLLDEPLSALDKNNKSLMVSVIKKVQQQLNIPMLYVSHYIDEIQQLANNILVLEKGRVLDYGNVHQVIHRLNNPAKASALIAQQTSLALSIHSHQPEFGLTRLSLNAKQEILMTLLAEQKNVGETLRCFIFASDISVMLQEPKNSSIVNQLLGKITDINEQSPSVLLTVNCSEHIFYTRITSFSLRQLSLNVGTEIYIQFKANAVKTLQYINGA